MSDSPAITVGALDGGLYLRMEGRATQRSCPTADRIVYAFLTGQTQPALISIDLNGCDFVDSTFAGWLLGIRKAVTPAEGRVRLLNCSSRCRKSLETMRLGRLFEFAEGGSPVGVQAVTCTTSDRPTRGELELMLHAHEELAALSPQNARVFAPIAAMLQQELQRKGSA